MAVSRAAQSSSHAAHDVPLASATSREPRHTGMPVQAAWQSECWVVPIVSGPAHSTASHAGGASTTASSGVSPSSCKAAQAVAHCSHSTTLATAISGTSHCSAGAQAVAPVVTLATVIAGGGRLLAFWKSVEWRVVRWALPGGVIGGAIGAVLFSVAPAPWLQILIGLFLISTVAQYRLGRVERTFRVRYWLFLPAQAVVGLISGLAGASGPILNVLYLNAKITKGRMAGTKTAVSLPMHAVKLAAYAAFGAMSGQIWLFGLAAGLGAFSANWLAKAWLERMPEIQFRGVVIAVMAVSGAVMVWDQRALMAGLFQ